MVAKVTGSRSFGTFRGVFIPTFLSIIGVILYLRLGFVVGSAGLIGTLLIIFLAVSITFATGLSISSITTNIRIGAGGAYSIIAKTLGLEVGGSVGIPLFLAQVFSVVLYVFGFTEGWQFIFPEHPRILIVVGAFLVLFLLTFISLKFAVRAQVIVFGIVLASLATVFAGGNWWQQILTVPAISSFPSSSFWALFALFFPAVTGLMAGIGMSGELTDPKKQIPRGVLWALGITTVIYVSVTFWFAYSASPAELVGDNLLIVKLAAYGPLVLVGILAATFSSALTTFVAAPRLLNALGGNAVLPFSGWLARKAKNGEPRNATLFVAILIFLLLTMGTLDSVAPILTIFFLITYSIINLVVFIEQSLGLVSFRPTFKIPIIIPLYGAVMSIIIMFYISVISGMAAMIFLFVTYLWLVKKKLQPKEEDVRSGLLYAFSEWAVKKISKLPESKKHIWKPNLLFPAVSSQTLLASYPVVRAIAYPKGTLSVLGMNVIKGETAAGVKLTPRRIKQEQKLLPQLVAKYGESGIFTTYAKIKADNYVDGVATSLEAIEGQFFHPNILFLPTDPKNLSKPGRKRIFESVDGTDVGLVFFDRDETIGLGSENDIHIWIPEAVLQKEFYDDRRFDLAMLIGYRLHRNWVGNLWLWMCVGKSQEELAKSYLKRLVYEGRFPKGTKITVSTNTFLKTLHDSPDGDIHIIPVLDRKELEWSLRITKKIKRSYLYIMDSKKEDILA